MRIRGAGRAIRVRALEIAAAVVALAALVGAAGTADARQAAPAATATATPRATSPASPTATSNLLVGTKGTFDTDTGGWAGGPATLSVTSSPVYGGKGSLAVRAPAGAATNAAAVSGSTPSSWTPVTAGWTYRATAQLRASRTGSTVLPVLSWFDAHGTLVGTAWGTPTSDRPSAWAASAPLNAIAPAKAAYASFGLIWYGTAGNDVHFVDAAEITATPPHALLGVYDAPFGATGDATELRAMEAWQRKEHAVVGLYTNWSREAADRLFATQLPATWAEGSIPMVSWMPWMGNDRDVDYNAEIASGSQDSYIIEWATRMRSFLSGADGIYGNGDDRRVFLRFAHEANGNWYPYAPGYGPTPAASYVAMWRHVRDVVTSVGLDSTRLAWVWSVINDDAYPGPSAEALYPGDAYVDWVGIDGYNWGNLHEPGESWETPEQVFAPMTARVRAITAKPLSINELGATTSGYSVAAKATWITQYFDWASANGVRMSAWFNDYPELWAVFGGSAGDGSYTAAGGSYLTYSAYRAAVQAPWLQGSSRQNARLVTDAQFLGL